MGAHLQTENGEVNNINVLQLLDLVVRKILKQDLCFSFVCSYLCTV